MVHTTVKVLIIRPDSTFDVLDVPQDLETLQTLVGGDLEPVYTSRAIIWCNEHGIRDDMPTNMMATYLLWKLDPRHEAINHLRGCVFVTGPGDNNGDMVDLPDDVSDLYGQMEGIRRDTAAGRL